MTIETMAKREPETTPASAVVDQKVVAELVTWASAEGLSLTGEGGLLRQCEHQAVPCRLGAEHVQHREPGLARDPRQLRQPWDQATLMPAEPATRRIAAPADRVGVDRHHIHACRHCRHASVRTNTATSALDAATGSTPFSSHSSRNSAKPRAYASIVRAARPRSVCRSRSASLSRPSASTGAQHGDGEVENGATVGRVGSCRQPCHKLNWRGRLVEVVPKQLLPLGSAWVDLDVARFVRTARRTVLRIALGRRTGRHVTRLAALPQPIS